MAGSKKITGLSSAVQTRPLDSHTYACNVVPEHCYGKYAHGGFAAAVVLNAVKQHFSTTLKALHQPDTFDLHLKFIRPLTVGEAQVRIEAAKEGRTSSTVRVILGRNGVENVVGYASNLDMSSEKGLSYPTSFEKQTVLPKANLSALLSGSDPGWKMFMFPDSPKSYLRGGSQLCWFTPTNGADDPSIIDLWLTPKSSEETFTTEAVASVADQWGVLAENFHPHSVWGTTYMAAGTTADDQSLGTDLSNPPLGFMTFSMSLHFKKTLPAEGVRFLAVRAQVKRAMDGRLDAEVLIFDDERQLVAISQQTMFFANNQKFSKVSGKL